MARRSDETLRVPIPMPMKGVNRNFARGSQPEGTCWDAKNVLPFDRQGRLRLALRGGASKRKDFDTNAKTRLLHVASTVFTTATVPNTFGNYSQTFDLGGNTELEGTVWDVRDTASYVVDDDAVVQVSGPPAYLRPKSGDLSSPMAALLIPSSTALLPKQYALESDIILDTTALSPGIGVMTRAAFDGSNITGIELRLGRNGMELLLHEVGNVTELGRYDISPPLAAGSQHNIRLEVNDDVFNCYLDGTLRIAAVGSTAFKTQNTVGIKTLNVQSGGNVPGGWVNFSFENLTGQWGYTPAPPHEDTQAGFYYSLTPPVGLSPSDIDFESLYSGWDVGTSTTGGGGLANVTAYLARLNGVRGAGFTEEPGVVQEMSSLRLLGFELGSVTFFSSGTAHTPADNFRFAAPLTSDLYQEGNSTQCYMSVRINQATPATTTGVITFTWLPWTGQWAFFVGTVQQDTGTDISLINDYPIIQVEGSTVNILTSDGARIITTQTVSNQNTANRGVAFGVASINSPSDQYSFMLAGPWVTVRGGINKSILKLVATSGPMTFVGGDPDHMRVVSNSLSFPVNGMGLYQSAATLFGRTYIVDGTSIRKLNLETNLFETYTASAGTAPSGCTIAVAWRGRLVLSGSKDDPQNIFASAVNDPTDWDYGVDPATETMAWNANAANLGRVGEPILALIPVSDDILLAIGEQSTWAVRGDLAANGSIDNVSESAGIVGQNAWTRAADGTLYWVGPNGLYRAAPDGSAPVEISRDVYRQFFQSINRSKQHVTLVYDKTRYGIWIFVTPEDQDEAPAMSLFYDLRMEGYWPICFDNLPVIGPLHAIYWDGYDDGARYPLLGSYDGCLYGINFNSRRDIDGVANQLIEGYVVLGPLSLSSVDDAVLTKLDITGGEVRSGDDPAVWHMAWTVNGGRDAYSVTEGTPEITASGTFTADGRASTQYPRVRGGWFTIRIGNENNPGDYFTIESVAAHVLPAGQQRA